MSKQLASKSLVESSKESADSSYIANSLYKEIYSLISTLFTLSTLTTLHYSLTKQLLSSSLSLTLLEENQYFYTVLLVENGKKIVEKKSNNKFDNEDIYIEVVVRVWKHGEAEALSLRQVHLNQYEEVYVKRNGIEFQNPTVKSEANKFLKSWLCDLQNLCLS